MVVDLRPMVDGPRLVLRHYGRVCNYLSSGVLSYSLAYGGECGSLHLIVGQNMKEGERMIKAKPGDTIVFDRPVEFLDGNILKRIKTRGAI